MLGMLFGNKKCKGMFVRFGFLGGASEVERLTRSTDEADVRPEVES
jgi:hypothetical protein